MSNTKDLLSVSGIGLISYALIPSPDDVLIFPPLIMIVVGIFMLALGVFL